MRELLAFIVAPATPAVAIFTLDHSANGVLVVAGFSYLLAFVLGGPAYWVLASRGWLHFWQVVLASALLGIPALSILIMLFTPSVRAVTAPFSREGLFFMALSALVGVAFWFIAYLGTSANKRFQPTQNASGVLRG